jgi:NAD(P)-dependent dehydrogenase (short-subunit alcohol dehydrogenase family)
MGVNMLQSSPLNFDFSGKVAFVSGAAAGIGEATAQAFGQAGAWVAVSDINEDGGLRTVHTIQSAGGEAIFFKCDVANPKSIENTMKDIVKNMGRIDFSFNNAGIEGESQSVVDCTEENWQRTMDINLRGVWLCMKHQIPIMLKNESGAIVNCSSIAGLGGFVNMPAYVASKHGVIGLTKTAALELATKNIRINSVCPGVIQTSMIDRLVHGDSNELKRLVQMEPMARVGRPEEIASAVLWLCSDQSSFVTGHSLVVDGGCKAN